MAVLKYASGLGYRWVKASVLDEDPDESGRTPIEHANGEKEWIYMGPESKPYARPLRSLHKLVNHGISLGKTRQPFCKSNMCRRGRKKGIMSDKTRGFLKTRFFLGVPQDIWSEGIFCYLDFMDVNCLGQTNRGAQALVLAIRTLKASNSDQWSTNRLAILKESVGPTKISYQGPYFNEQNEQFCHVHATETVRFLLKSIDKREIYEVRFRKGRFLWSENIENAQRLLDSDSPLATEQTWMDCRILKKNVCVDKSSFATVLFETTPSPFLEFESGEVNPQKGFIVNNQSLGSHTIGPDLECCVCCSDSDPFEFV